MRIVTKYVSILGREFDTIAAAMADEDRLPAIIATYTESVRKLRAGEEFAGKPGPHPQADIDGFAAMLADYEAKWAVVQKERADMDWAEKHLTDIAP